MVSENKVEANRRNERPFLRTLDASFKMRKAADELEPHRSSNHMVACKFAERGTESACENDSWATTVPFREPIVASDVIAPTEFSRSFELVGPENRSTSERPVSASNPDSPNELSWRICGTLPDENGVRMLA